MAKYKAYPEYKDSGVEWLGEIPLNWNYTPHKYLAVYYKGRTPTTLSSEPKRDCVPYLSMSYLRTNIVEHYTLVTSDARVVPDDLVLIIWDGSNAGEFIKSKSGILSSTMAVANITPKSSHQYYWFSCNCIEPEIRRHATGMGIPHVNGEHLRYIAIPSPSVDEQIKISQFLIHETMKIDLLVEKQQQLIELLKEKRQAVISHAVTKGLNPDLPMKNCGIEWCGSTPAHWSSLKLKYIFSIQKNIAGKTGFEILSITQRGIVIKDTQSGEGQLSMDYSKYQRVEPGKFAMNHMDLLTGYVDISKYDGVTSPDYRVFYLKNNIAFHDKYYLYLLQNGYKQRLFFHLGQGSSHLGRWRLPTEAFNEINYPVPPYIEQKRITSHINNETTKIDTLIQKQLQQIELLKERRTALISAAVTGKIDLRDWTPPASSTETSLTAEEATA